jgi:hypothetical protein
MKIMGKNTGDNTCRIPLTEAEREICHAQNTQPKLSDLSWRIFRIMGEFVDGFQFLSQFKREVTFFGSARLKPENKWYQEAVKLGGMLADNDFTVITGGGPGIMEAGNKGAYDAGGESVGMNIQLPMEQSVNPYVRSPKGFHYFFTRKVMLAASAQAYVYFPGGFGTMDELFEILTLVQTGKSEHIPIVLVGKEYFDGLVEWIQSVMYEKFDAIDKSDIDLFTVVDSAEEAFEIIKKSEERGLF